MTGRVAVIVLDGVGCGAASDAGAYGDVGSNTLGHVLEQSPSLALPAMERLGLGHVGVLRGVNAVPAPCGTSLATPHRRGPVQVGADAR